jgi:hypothetical protein
MNLNELDVFVIDMVSGAIFMTVYFYRPSLKYFLFACLAFSLAFFQGYLAYKKTKLEEFYSKYLE